MTSPEQELAALRAKIDGIDEKISALLIERIGIIREVAALKAAHWPQNCHIRPAREGQMHQAIAKRFMGSAFPPLAALAIWRQLIGASTNLESPLNITVLSAHPEHVWMAREYFGVEIGLQVVPTLVDALANIRNETSNIILLPCPTKDEWWRGAQGIRAAEITIFASLPVSGNNLPPSAIPAVALAKLSPEDSGDDVSYHVDNNELVTRAGFHPGEPGIFLGAHPRAITLG